MYNTTTMNNSLFIILTLFLIVFNVGAVVYFLISNRSRNNENGKNGAVDAALAEQKAKFQTEQLSQMTKMFIQQMSELSRTVDGKMNTVTQVLDNKMGDTAKMVQESFRTQASESFRVIKDITERLTKLDETNKQVVSFADQLQSLQDILKNPKQRGILGEYYLETLLKNVLPTGSFQMQYAFKDSTIVDAVVFVRDKVIPIDSKFSLENYNRLSEERDPVEKEKLEKAFRNDLKNRIDETSKYIKPEEGTMEFAFMFIPHEAIYYDLLISQVGSTKINTRDLIEYAFKEKHVCIVSPTSFLAFLQTVLQGLKALQIEESAKDIRKRVGDLGRHLAEYDQHVKTLGVNLGKTVSSYNKSYSELKKIDKDIFRISDKAVLAGIEPLIIEKPVEDGEEGD
jgi:DNA recombination protein RmuC